MPQVKFTITIGALKKSDAATLAAWIEEKAEGLFEDATLQHGRPMTMLVGQREWKNLKQRAKPEPYSRGCLAREVPGATCLAPNCDC